MIINIASVLALHSLPGSSVYSGTKGFVLNFSRGLQDEAAETKVRVQVVLPASTATEIWNELTLPLSALPPETVMSAENMVDAALAGYYRGEAITLPSVADPSLWDKYDTARTTLFAATQTGRLHDTRWPEVTLTRQDGSRLKENDQCRPMYAR